MAATFYAQSSANRRNSFLLVLVVVALLGALGFLIGFAWSGETAGGIGGLGILGIVAIVMSIVSYYTGDRLVLGVSGAREVTEADQPQLVNVVREISLAAGVLVPRVYLIEDSAPNAFATGRDPRHASVAVTTGLLDKLDREELQGVIAHELSHVRNYDIRFATLVGILVGMIALVSDFFLRSRWFGWGRREGGDSGGAGAIMMIVAIVLAILAPLAAYATQFAISRRREYLADASGVELTRNPLGLARALQKIAAEPHRLRGANRATAHLFIENPLRKTKAVTTVFDTHPPVEKRIAVLLEMAHVGPEALGGGGTPVGAPPSQSSAASASR
jgi:heat shock protein HtpX